MKNGLAPDAVAANRLWVELTTRITGNPLHYRSGDEETAATSVYSLFETVRAVLADHPDATQFAACAIPMLNHTIRPYTARWHGWLVNAKLAGERYRRTFRSELIELRDKLGIYETALDALRQGKSVPEQIGAWIASESDAAQTAMLGAPIAAGIGRQVIVAPAESHADTAPIVAEINAKEHDAIRARRAQLRPGVSGNADGQLLDATGLAFSGGGIRSATFCLGVAQSLHRRRMLAPFDYLSTVSGGGYFGSFLSCALGAPPTAKDDTITKRFADVFEGDSGIESGLIRHLRNHSKYLLDGGLRTKLQIARLVLSGILINFLLVLPIPFLAALGIWQMDRLGYWGEATFGSAPLPSWGSWAGVHLICAGIVAGIVFLIVPLVQRFAHGKPSRSPLFVLREVVEWMMIILGVWAAIAAILFLLPGLFHALKRIESLDPSKPFDVAPWVMGGISAALGTASRLVGPAWPRLRVLLVKLFILSGPLLLLTVFLCVCNRLGLGVTDGEAKWPAPVVAGATLGVLLWAWCFVNVNTSAPHRFYRQRLCSCYLARRPFADKPGFLRRHAGEDRQLRTQTVQHVPLTKLGEFAAAPYHLINTTVNLPTSRNRELRGRNGDFFVVTRDYCGSPIVGYVKTEAIEKVDPHFDLGTAMAVSGAAASANMGWKSLPNFRFLMALFNVRLGYWLRRPDLKKHTVPTGFPGPLYFFCELFGKFDEGMRYLNLSDGGHIENLAVYELLRRRCKFIVCVDGGCEPGMECSDLMRLQRYAEIDLGIRMEYDVADVSRLDADRHTRAYAILVKIDYAPAVADEVPKAAKDAQLGWMLYLKLATTGAEPPYVLDYRRENPAFPHESTGDQLYEEAQFESYRMLGEVAMESLFRSELVGAKSPDSIAQWFQALADNLLPDNDAVFPARPSPRPVGNGLQ